MTIALLNGAFMPLAEARISPMDRGFLFGDGIYEVIPSYGGKMVGFDRHIERLNDGLAAIGLHNPLSQEQWLDTLSELLAKNGRGSLALYLQVTRGVVAQRAHKFPDDPQPTVFAYTFAIGDPPTGDPLTAKGFSVATGEDLRWQRCHIKSVALLGNVLHMMEGVNRGADEILLFNNNSELTEAAACNVFIVSGTTVATPILDNQKLPGITRNMLLDIMRAHGPWTVEERVITRDEVMDADEVWLTSSTKEIAPVITIDGDAVGNGAPGPVWSKAQALFAQHRFAY